MYAETMLKYIFEIVLKIYTFKNTQTSKYVKINYP